MQTTKWIPAVAVALMAGSGAQPLAAQIQPPPEPGRVLTEPLERPRSSGDLYPDSIPRLLGQFFLAGPLYIGDWEMNQAIGFAGRYRLSERLTLIGRGQLEMTVGWREAVRFFPALDLGYSLTPDQSTGVLELRAGTAVLAGRLWGTAGVAGYTRPMGPQGIGRFLSAWFDTRMAATDIGVSLWITLGIGIEFPELRRDTSAGGP